MAEEIGRAEWLAVRSSDTGTLYISYDAEKDELHRSFTGYGPVNAWNTATCLLKNRWKGKPLYPFVGGSLSGVPLAEGGVWIDDFVVDSGLANLHLYSILPLGGYVRDSSASSRILEGKADNE